MASNADTTALITGPTGAGKGEVAEFIHSMSKRADSSFLDLNCAGLSASLLEPELFGHEQGAFTDARQMKKGLMEVSDGGTLFFDEIAEMPLSVQAKVLKVIETKTFRRMGGTVNLSSDVRIIAATNSDLMKKVEEGSFRRDLYYRLNILPIELKPLSERKSEIQELAMMFLGEFSSKTNKDIAGFSQDAMDLLMSSQWPGNIRELRNVIERAVILCRDKKITAKYLPQELKYQEPASSSFAESRAMTLKDLEKMHILRTLEMTNNNKAQAARILDIDVTTLNRKLKRYSSSI